MLGTNPVRPQELTDGKSLWVQEVFYTLQGEGPFSGQPSVFIRLGGCNLSCYWCDTDFESSTWNPSLQDLLAQVESIRPKHCDLIVITGGEPFRQNIEPLVSHFLENGLRVQIETNGTLWVDLPDSPSLFIVCSPKAAFVHPKILERANAFKYVVSADGISANDGLPTNSTQKASVDCMIRRPPEGANVFVMPLDTGSQTANEENIRACVESAKTFGYRLTLQTHKIAGFR